MERILFFHKTLFLPLLLIGLSWGFLQNAQAAAPAKVQKTVEEHIDNQQKAMTEGQACEKEQTLLQQQINQAKLEVEWYNLHIQTLKRYVEKAKGNVQTLNETKEELERLEIALEESLVTSVAQLSSFVQSDLPFLAEERQDRITFLRSSLDDYTVGLEEKLRRVFEALQVESDYAKSHEITSETIDTATGKHAVKILRLGRVALFALSSDGTQGWQYTTAGYVPLAEQYLEGLQTLMQENVQTLPALPFKGAQ